MGTLGAFSKFAGRQRHFPLSVRENSEYIVMDQNVFLLEEIAAKVGLPRALLRS
jgi:hypothetical protein